MTPLTTTDETARPPGRPRNPETDGVILDVTLALLAESGYPGLSVEAVAARAGVGKATIYRRWPSKEALVAAAFERSKGEIVMPDTGSTYDDLLALFTRWQELLQEWGGPALAQFLTALTSARFMEPYWEEYGKPRWEALATLLERGKARGELRPDLDVRLAIEMLLGIVLYELLLGRIAPVSTDDLPRRAVETMWRGIAAGGRD